MGLEASPVLPNSLQANSLPSAKSDADLTRVILNIIIKVPIKTNQETQHVVKGTMNVPNVAVNSPDHISNKVGFHGGIHSIGLLRHIHLERERKNLSKDSTAPTNISTNNGGNSSHVWSRRHEQGQDWLRGKGRMGEKGKKQLSPYCQGHSHPKLLVALGVGSKLSADKIQPTTHKLTGYGQYSGVVPWPLNNDGWC